MDILPSSTARSQSDEGYFEAGELLSTPLCVATPTSSVSPILTVMSVTDLPSFQMQISQLISPANSIFNMTLSPSLNSIDIFNSSLSRKQVECALKSLTKEYFDVRF